MTTTAIEIIEKEIGLLEHNLHSLKAARDILLDAATTPNTQVEDESSDSQHRKHWTANDEKILCKEWSERKKSESVYGFDERMMKRFGRSRSSVQGMRSKLNLTIRDQK